MPGRPGSGAPRARPGPLLTITETTMPKLRTTPGTAPPQPDRYRPAWCAAEPGHARLHRAARECLPGRVDARGRGDDKPGQRAGHHQQREQRTRLALQPAGLSPRAQVWGKETAKQQILGADDREPRQRHKRRETTERRPGGRELQQGGPS